MYQIVKCEDFIGSCQGATCGKISRPWGSLFTTSLPALISTAAGKGHGHICFLPWVSKSVPVSQGPSRLTWGTTSLRNCASLPQADSVGKSVRVAVCTGAAVPLRIGKHCLFWSIKSRLEIKLWGPPHWKTLSILEHQVTIRNKIMRKGFILNLQKYLCTVLICAYSSW
jgi:hypothetical protein